MNDRYLCKAKRIDNGEWVKGYLIKSFTGICYIVTHFDHILSNINYYEVDEKTICQCTKLPDKNGKKIWENDIVQRTDLHDAKKPSIGFIEYDVENTAFLIHWVDVVNYSATYPWKEKIEVVGNIFDNPELLEGGTE